MRFQVSDYLRQATGYEAQRELREPSLQFDDDSIIRDLVGRVTFLRTNRGLLVSATADCVSCAACSRCLTEVEDRLAIKFQEEYLSTVDINTGLALPMDADNDDFLIDGEFSLDLGEALRQYKVMEEPIKPLCQPDCRGLCPGCGQNLNLGPCNCPTGLDDRWTALSGLADKLKHREGR